LGDRLLVSIDFDFGSNEMGGHSFYKNSNSLIERTLREILKALRSNAFKISLGLRHLVAISCLSWKIALALTRGLSPLPV
jgi:hypothetical protein